MNTRSASRLIFTVLFTVGLSAVSEAASPCITDTLTNYIEVYRCTINNRTFSKFEVFAANNISSDDITVTPIQTKSYVGLEFTGFNKATDPTFGLRIDYQVDALDGDDKPSTPFTEVIVNLDDINAPFLTGALAGMEYTAKMGSDIVSVEARGPTPTSKRAAAEFAKNPVITVKSEMGAITTWGGNKATFRAVRNRFYPAQ
jgi:hypothetical protein